MTDEGERRMTPRQLARLIDAYGADPSRFPEDVRAAAEHLLAHSPQARGLADAAARLDFVLDGLGAPPPPTAALTASVRRLVPGSARQLPRATAGRSIVAWLQSLSLRPVALAVATLAGLGIGLILPSPFASPPSTIESVDYSEADPTSSADSVALEEMDELGGEPMATGLASRGASESGVEEEPELPLI